MLTLFQSPEAISLSRNPVLYKIKATRPNGDDYDGKSANSQMIINQKLLNGEVLKVEWNDIEGNDFSVSFTAVANPVTVDQIPDDSYAGDTGAYLTLVKQIIEVHPEITLDFTLEIFGSDAIGSTQKRIVICTNIKHVDYSVVWNVDGIANNTAINITTFYPNQTSLPENHKVLLEVIFQPGQTGNYVKVASLEDTIDDDSFVYFNIQDVLDAELKNSIAHGLPAFGANQPLVADNTRNFFVRYTESFGNPGLAQEWVFSPVRKVMFGGESVERFNNCPLFENLEASNSLLTWYPDGKRISTDSPEFLPWINFTNATKSVYLQLELYSSTDDSPTVVNRFNSNATAGMVNAWQTLLMPCGYTQLDLQSEGADIAKYSVQIMDLVFQAPLSQKRTFYVDRDYHYCKRHIMYLNGFNVPQTLRLTGERSKELKVKRQKSIRTLAPVPDLLAGEIVQHDQGFENNYTYRSGYLSANEVDALQELLIYNKAFELYSDGYRRLYLTDKKFKIGECLQFLRSIQFNAIPSVQMKNYSNYLIACEEANLCGPQNWQDPDGECWKTSDDINWREA